MEKPLSRPAPPATTTAHPVLAVRLVSAVLATLLVGVGLVAGLARPASASGHLGESEMTMSLTPGNQVVYPEKIVVNVQVRDVSDSCESPLFPSCDHPQGIIQVFIDGVSQGVYDLNAPEFSQYDDRSWLSVDIGFPDAGVHEIAVEYSGDFEEARASTTLTVSQGDCTLTLTQNKAQTTEGEVVAFSVDTPFEPGNLVTFFDENSRNLGEVPIYWDGWTNFGAYFEISTLPVGTTEVHAFYMSMNYHPCISNFVNHTVVPRNTAPVADDDASYTMLGEPVTIDVLSNDVDAENHPLTVSLAAPPANGQATVNGDGSITYIPNAGFTGPLDTFDYRIAEPSGLSDVATVTVFVVCLIEQDDSYAVGHNTPLVVAAPGVLANDEHACDPTRGVSLADPPQHGTVELQPTGGFTYTPNSGYSGTDTFTYVFTNTLLQGPAATVTLTVADPPPNRAPTATDGAATALEGGPTQLTLAGTDPDGDPLSYTVTAGPAHGTLSGAAPNLTYTPAPGYVGLDSFEFTVEDGRGGTDTGMVSLTVTAATPVATQVAALGGTRLVFPQEVAYENLHARLTRSDTGAPLPGQTVTFTIDGTTICSAVTTASGDATCSSGRFPKASLRGGVNYTATYAGDGHNLLASSGSGTVQSRGASSN